MMGGFIENQFSIYDNLNVSGWNIFGDYFFDDCGINLIYHKFKKHVGEKTIYFASLFYKRDETEHISSIFLSTMKNEGRMSTYMITREKYRGLGLMNEANEIIEDLIIPKIIDNKLNLLFRAEKPINPDTEKFVREYFIKRGYKDLDGSLVKIFKK